MKNFENKTVFITGGSRGIGLAIALKLAAEGANIVIAAKTDNPHPTLPGTIYTAAEEIEQVGGKALPIRCDIRFEEQVDEAVAIAVKHFKVIDILINNASAIALSSTEQLPMKRFDLLHQVNSRGTYMVSQKCIPHLKQSDNPHILTLAPPLNMDKKWFSSHLGYTMSKYGMSMCVLGMAEEYKTDKIAVNALWPMTAIATAAIKYILGGEEIIKRSRSPEIVADAAYCILKRNSKACTGNFFIDEEVLKEEGIDNFDHYAIEKDKQLKTDLFL